MHSLGAINFVGHLSLSAGLGVISRNVIIALVEKGYSVAGFDVAIGEGRRKAEMPAGVRCVDTIDELPDGINLVCTSIQTLPSLLLRQHPSLLSSRFSNAAIVYWELPVIPSVWVKALSFFDVLVAGSPFVRTALERSLPLKPSVLIDYPLYIPDAPPRPRSHLAIPDDAVLFGASFDFGSDLGRKNPGAIVRAFQEAFPARDDVFLLLKGNGYEAEMRRHPAMHDVMRAIEEDGRIRYVCETLPYPEVLSLYASCDVYVSLHRAEGLGLGPLEAMALGKAVVATGFSGNMAYMTPGNSFSVRYRLVEPTMCNWQYTRAYAGPGAFWAEPDVMHAAALFRELADSRETRERLGRIARRDFQERNALARQVPFIDDVKAFCSAPGARRERRNRLELLVHDMLNPMHIRNRLRQLWA